MVYCVALNCQNGSNRNQTLERKIGFFSFPKDKKYFKIWCDKIRRKDWYPSRLSKLCSDHFDTSCFKQNLAALSSIGWIPRKLELKADAIPTKFDYFNKIAAKRKAPVPRQAFAKRRRQEVSYVASSGNQLEFIIIYSKVIYYGFKTVYLIFQLIKDLLESVTSSQIVNEREVYPSTTTRSRVRTDAKICTFYKFGSFEKHYGNSAQSVKQTQTEKTVCSKLFLISTKSDLAYMHCVFPPRIYDM